MSTSSTIRTRTCVPGRHHCRAFTLVELLVVVVVIAVVLSLLLMVGGHVFDSQKRSTTQNTMRLTEMAIEQFKTTNPLQSTYDNAARRVVVFGAPVFVGRTFGPYPPYQVAGNTAGVGVATTVRGALEPTEAISDWSSDDTLAGRLKEDLQLTGTGEKYILMQDPTVAPATDDDFLAFYSYDNRALYSYLAAFTPGVLNQIPESAKRPLRVPPGAAAGKNREFIDPDGGLTPGNSRAFDILGICDAWGVPLDYFLQAKLEFKVPPTGTAQTWQVTDRVPVLRSRGLAREKVVAADRARHAGDTTLADHAEGSAFYSQSFPSPAFNSRKIDEEGSFPGAVADDGGWVRVRPGLATDKKTWDAFTFVPTTGQ